MQRVRNVTGSPRRGKNETDQSPTNEDANRIIVLNKGEKEIGPEANLIIHEEAEQSALDNTVQSNDDEAIKQLGTSQSL